MNKPYLGEADYQADLKKAKKKEKSAWALKHRKTKKINYWYIDYQNGLVFLILGVPTPVMKSFWNMVVNLLNAHNVIASADLSAYGIK